MPEIILDLPCDTQEFPTVSLSLSLSLSLSQPNSASAFLYLSLSQNLLRGRTKKKERGILNPERMSSVGH
jgi:hypothetical protein